MMYFFMLLLKKKKVNPNGIELSFIEKILYFLLNPFWFKYISDWMNSFNSQKKSIELEIPWFTYGAINWIDKNLKKNMIVFEYGSGGSTLFISKKVNKIYSVEHDKKWFNLINSKLSEKKLKNVKIFLRIPQKLNKIKDIEYTFKSYTSNTFNEYKNFSFKNYVRTIDYFPNNYFDLIIIDGRSRASCVFHSINKIKKGGYLLLDNSERLEYKIINIFLSKLNFSKTDYFGFGPFLKTFWQTTIWKKIN